VYRNRRARSFKLQRSDTIAQDGFTFDYCLDSVRGKEHAAAMRLTEFFWVLFYRHVTPAALGARKFERPARRRAGQARVPVLPLRK
jgi:hypothetical protein